LNIKHGGNIYAYARQYKLPINEIIDASASVVPFETPRYITNSLIKDIKNSIYCYYPDQELADLREAIGIFHNINPDNVMPGNGASELITWAGSEAAKYGKSGLISPGFMDYERSLNCWGANYIIEELPHICASKFPETFPINPKSDVIWITNPHNPTGQLWNQDSLKRVLTKYKLVICDEAFLSITPNGENESLIPLTKDYKNLLVIRSLTKLFRIAGLRLGYMIGSSQILNSLINKRDPWPLNNFSIRAGITILNNRKQYIKWTTKIHNWIKQEKKWIFPELAKIKELKIHNSSTNFFLIESSKSLLPNINYLATKGIIIRECNSFRSLNEKWARISLQTPKKNKRLIKEIQQSFLN